MTEQPQLPFADEPRTELDRALRDLMARADDVLHAQGRLRELLRATAAVVESAELPVVLERIVEAAVALVDARYGALGVIGAAGEGLEEFVHAGMDDDVVAAIGHLPEGRGVLGALIDDPQPIRLAHIEDHPRSVGFPAGHPRMGAFLGVPIRVRDEVFGNLYLADPHVGEFTEEDEQLVRALASTAGFVIANARQLEESRLRQEWSATSAQIASAMLESTRADPLPLLADELIARTTADRVCLVLPGDEAGTVRIAEARGDGAAELDGAALPAMSTMAALVFEDGVTRTRPGARHDPTPDALAIAAPDDGVGSALFLPLRSDAATWGVLAVARRPGRPAFSATEVDLADDLAARLALAVELARAREHRQQALLAEDRARIARDLHDQVIQQLFGAGLALDALAESGVGDEASARLRSATATLDESIAQIRAIIFALTPRGEGGESMRHRVLDIVSEYSSGFAEPVAVRFSGPVDLMVTGALADDVVAVVRELLANVVKHAAATSAGLEVSAGGHEVRVVVQDDGVGVAPHGRRSGLANLSARAAARGGSFDLGSEDGRTRAIWAAPLATGDD
ncbi:histidine kinase [Agromyces rhizosphaerae]|uniref:Histidine kinase n=1 Tax=Agromyces rhizosphaerae TaxID=88374 RepID=A0A9W6FSC7_9MICO|nr:GAF domain-containing protein [Agromyces rhizosphaerae]GLI28607.1 histidine kinase [Agromyces rhizosphaerae]